MLDIGFQELLLILVIALLVFGPKRLPELGRAVGRAMREFRRASDEFRSTVETNLRLNEPDPIPFTPEPAPADTGSAVTAGVAEPVPQPVPGAAEVAIAAPSGEPYWAQRGSRLFHAQGCGWAGRIPEAERLYFKRVADAREQGFVTCPVCEPWEPA